MVAGALRRLNAGAMIQTTTVERELTALAEMRLRWRNKPEVVEMIDAATPTAGGQGGFTE